MGFPENVRLCTEFSQAAKQKLGESCRVLERGGSLQKAPGKETRELR